MSDTVSDSLLLELLNFFSNIYFSAECADTIKYFNVNNFLRLVSKTFLNVLCVMKYKGMNFVIYT